MALKWRPDMTEAEEHELMESIRREEDAEYEAWMDELEAEAMSRDRECDEDEQFYPEDDEDQDSDDPRENGWVGQDGQP